MEWPCVKYSLCLLNMTKVKAPFLIALGKAIRCKREALGYTQEGFADELGLGRGYYWRVENGELNIRVSKLADIASGLKTTAAELLKQTEEFLKKKN